MKRLFTSLIVLLFAALGSAAQSQPQAANPEQSNTTLRSTAQEVLLDMVFRDKKGKAIRDVRPEEIHILEDGVEQNLASFHLVEGANAEISVPGTTTAPGRVDPMREIRLRTLEFSRPETQGERLFRQRLERALAT